MVTAVLGGTGRTGRLVIKALLAQGHKVRCLARDPEKIAPAFGLDFVKGDASDGGKVMLTLTGCEAVVVVLGTAKGSRSDICSVGTALALKAMEKVGIRRIVAVTSLGVGDSRDQLPGILKFLFGTFMKHELEDKDLQEKYLEASKANWTVIRPGGLVDKDPGGAVKTGEDRQTMAGRITRQAVAEFTARVLGDSSTHGKKLYITT